MPVQDHQRPSVAFLVAVWLGWGSVALPAIAEPPVEHAATTGELTPDWRHRLIAPDAVRIQDAPPLPLVGRRFEGSRRFEVEYVPPGVTVHRVGDAPPTWEFRNAEGRRIALLQEEQWRHVMHPRLGPESAPFWTQAAGTTRVLKNWGGAPARVRCEQLLTPLRLYRIERLAKGTDFLVMGFIYKDTVYSPYEK